MSLVKKLLFFMLLCSLTASFQINLDLTDCVHDSESDFAVQHDCLHVAAPINEENDPREIISYCMSECPSKWYIQKSNNNQIFTFAELYGQNITSRQLYRWSAPMDTVEQYQLYLNQLPISNETSMATQRFYNCTPPKFGSMCQYTFEDDNPYNTSLNKIIDDFYQFKYEPSTFTCYTHLQCNRGPAPICLDWSEICDGKVDCLDGGQDEEHCWQLEIIECGNDQYQCGNGQCIPYEFFRDHRFVPDCLDGTDEIVRQNEKREHCHTSIPTFLCEDIICMNNYHHLANLFTSSCVKNRDELIRKATAWNKPTFVSDNCWIAIMCIIPNPHTWVNQSCTDLCRNGTCEEIIKKNCSDMLYIPAAPTLFGHVHILFMKNDLENSRGNRRRPKYVCFDNRLCDQITVTMSLISFNNATCYPYTDINENMILDFGKLLF
jgi:hypothetical protein